LGAARAWHGAAVVVTAHAVAAMEHAMIAKRLKDTQQNGTSGAPARADQHKQNKNTGRARGPGRPAKRKRPPMSAQTRAGSKQEKVVALLSRPEGASVSVIMKMTGWQRHSVHGFFSGVLRKRLKFKVEHTGEGDKTIYRIASGSGSTKIRHPERSDRPRQGKR
jgi:hypothetical protein